MPTGLGISDSDLGRCSHQKGKVGSWFIREILPCMTGMGWFLLKNCPTLSILNADMFPVPTTGLLEMIIHIISAPGLLCPTGWKESGRCWTRKRDIGTEDFKRMLRDQTSHFARKMTPCIPGGSGRIIPRGSIKCIHQSSRIGIITWRPSSRPP